jgi:dihydrodipicolinate synthase/N-acetylneuraminate lyase
VAFGTTGEHGTLTEDERALVLRTCARVCREQRTADCSPSW